jgi:DNA-binding NarL/FixJ family response regulator
MAEQMGRPIPTTKIRVLLAEDHTIMRYTLRSVLRHYSDIEIVGEATDGEDAIAKTEQLRPAIVLMDINMPRLDGIAATRRITGNQSQVFVIGLSVDADGHSVEAMRRAGAVTVVPKERAADDLYDAIHRAVALRPEVTGAPPIPGGKSDAAFDIDVSGQSIYVTESPAHAPNPTTSMPDL